MKISDVPFSLPQGVIASKGIINNAQHIGFVLSRAHPESKVDGQGESELSEAQSGVSDESVSNSNS